MYYIKRDGERFTDMVTESYAAALLAVEFLSESDPNHTWEIGIKKGGE